MYAPYDYVYIHSYQQLSTEEGRSSSVLLLRMELIMKDTYRTPAMSAMLATEFATFSSLEIAKAYSKDHGHVLRDIRKLQDIGTIESFVATTYKCAANQTRPVYMLTADSAEVLINKYQGLRVSKGARERDCLATIEQVLNIKLLRQFAVGNYRIDGYDPLTKTAYEIDEDQHLSLNHSQADDERQTYIQTHLGCKFVRVFI